MNLPGRDLLSREKAFVDNDGRPWNGFLIRLEGDIDISCSNELKQMLTDALFDRKDLQLDVALVTDLDITAIQLFWAAAREAEKTGASIVVAGQVPGNISCAIREAGFDRFPVSATAPAEPGSATPMTAESADDRQV